MYRTRRGECKNDKYQSHRSGTCSNDYLKRGNGREKREAIKTIASEIFICTH